MDKSVINLLQNYIKSTKIFNIIILGNDNNSNLCGRMWYVQQISYIFVNRSRGEVKQKKWKRKYDRDRILLMGVRSNIQPRHLQISQADAMKKVKECFNIFKRFSVETNGKIYGTTKEIGVLVVIMICLQIEKKCC